MVRGGAVRAVAARGGQGGQGGRGGFGGGQGQGGGRGGFGGQGGFGGMMGNQTPSAATLPLRLMVSYLGLSDAQVGKIALSRDDMQEASRPAPMRRPAGGAPDGQPGQGGPGGGGMDMQAMMAEMQAKRQSAEKKAVAEIRTILSPEQSTKLATLIKAMESLRTAGYRPEAAGKLQLNDEQLTRIARGGAIESILTPDQMAIAETFRMPRGGPGGPGGPGGFGGGPGGFGGGPGGQGGPPPPPEDQE
jgi:hypothetical protein